MTEYVKPDSLAKDVPMSKRSEADSFTLTDWLTSTQEMRDALDAYGKSPLPADASERHADMDRAIQNQDDASRLLADAESFLVQAEANAVFQIRNEHPDLTADERKKVAKDAVRHIKRLVDGLAATHQSIRSRIFASMNAGRSR